MLVSSMWKTTISGFGLLSITTSTPLPTCSVFFHCRSSVCHMFASYTPLHRMCSTVCTIAERADRMTDGKASRNKYFCNNNVLHDLLVTLL
ncbi:hypothetical protein BDF22DRAFT_233042 [Syncephalis plumigaleata]|nr:hypothetical protein BDF22DRAFT_233042 [Syncephalis plumigaleata]